MFGIFNEICKVCTGKLLKIKCCRTFYLIVCNSHVQEIAQVLSLCINGQMRIYVTHFYLLTILVAFFKI